MPRTALVIGGTGPTGPCVIEGLLQRGYRVSILHRGVHEVELPAEVEHIHADPHFTATLTEALAVFAENDVYNLPVVADSEHRRLVGVITRSRLMSHYHQELQMRTETAPRF